MKQDFRQIRGGVISKARDVITRTRTGVYLMIVSLPLVLNACGGGSKNDGLTINTTEGYVRGFVSNGVKQFFGIPYAASPTGDLRWRAPVAAAKRTQTLNATTKSQSCAQQALLGPFSAASSAEDCLYTNIYRPNNNNTNLPTMVWIHGGGGLVGTGNDYDGSKLARDGNTVVITFNYRLNVLGFFAHPSLLGEENNLANYGLMDQQFLLKWVKQNAANFGGDANNVTLFGESSGGIYIAAHLAAPSSNGLYHKGIIQSGLTAFSDTPATSLAEATTNSENFATAAGCMPQTAACLRELSVASLMEHGSMGVSSANLIAEDAILPQSPYGLLASGNFNRVPLIIGNTLDEDNFFAFMDPNTEIAPGTYETRINAKFGADAPAVLALYPESNYATPSLAWAETVNHQRFLEPLLRWSKAAAQYTTVYTYLFADRTAPSYAPGIPWLPFGAAHTLEMQYLFPLWKGAGTAAPLNAAQEVLSNDMVSYWTNFARTGNPNSATTPNWPALDNSELIQRLDLPRSATMSNFSTLYNVPFWDSLR